MIIGGFMTVEVIRKISKGRKEYYQCEKCKLIYEDKKWAEKCFEWCKKSCSCNLEITKHSLNVKGGKTKEWTKL